MRNNMHVERREGLGTRLGGGLVSRLPCPGAVLYCISAFDASAHAHILLPGRPYRSLMHVTCWNMDIHNNILQLPIILLGECLAFLASGSDPTI